jgi:hypothetical protein
MKIILFLLLPISVSAQSVGVGHSVKFWGQAQNVTHINIQHNDFAVHYFHSHSDKSYYSQKNNQSVGKITNSISSSWTPLNYKFISSGIIVSPQNFPTKQSSKINFIIGIDIPIRQFTISYKHISNGFGIQNPINIGADFLSISISM